MLLSFETGHLKPSPKAWQHVIDHYGCDPGDICFLDDAEGNVLAARQSGLQSYSVSGEEALLKIVKELTGNLN